MANEIFFSDLVTSGARVSAVLHQTILQKLTDTASLVNHPSVLNFGAMNGMGSSVLKVPVISYGADAMAAVAENASASNTNLTTSSASITIARQALVRQISDLAQLTANGATNVTVEALADDMVAAYNKRVTTMLCALSSGFSSSVGTTNTTLTVANFYNAIFALQLVANDGTFVAALHPKQINDLIGSLRSEVGPGQYLAATQEQMNAKGPGLRGVLFGVELHGFTAVPTANAGVDRLGYMFTRGAVGVATGSAAPVRGAADVMLPAGTPIVVETSRSPEAGLSTITGSAFVGVAELDDARGVGVLSKA